jgi:pimeloyl-ACP methyl ester carboxylesterase
MKAEGTRDAGRLGGRRRLSAATLSLAVATACQSGCPPSVSWQPDVLAPVFYGWKDFDAPVAPGRLRVWYPSVDGAPDGAPIVTPAGHYPLVVLLHGQCSQDPDHYKTWFLLPAQLARSGYVVAVPDLPQIKSGSRPWDPGNDIALVEAVMTWMRTDWADRAQLMPAPFTAIVGHSYGALLGGRMVSAAPANFKAFASLGGVWSEWPTLPPSPVAALGVPAFFAWADGDFSANLTPLWTGAAVPKHQAKFKNGTHFDYWRTGASATTPCDSNPGTCGLIGALSADLTTIFLSKYLPPEQSGVAANGVPDTFVLPTSTPTPEQQRFAGGHLTGLGRLPNQTECGVTLKWETAQGSGSKTLP